MSRAPLNRIAGWIGYAVGKGIMALLGRVLWRLEMSGQENIPTSGPFILSPVHRSYIDGPLTAVFTERRMRYLAKDTVFKVRPLGWLFKQMGAIPVQRDAVDRESLHACLEVLQSGLPLVLFPEGTRKEGPTLQEVNEGAAYLALRTGAPVVPVGIGGSAKAMPKGSKIFRFAKVVVIIGEPITLTLPASGRASRSAIREGTEVITARIQQLFDDAEKRVA